MAQRMVPYASDVLDANGSVVEEVAVVVVDDHRTHLDSRRGVDEEAVLHTARRLLLAVPLGMVLYSAAFQL
jgi:hypothetical protein